MQLTLLFIVLDLFVTYQFSKYARAVNFDGDKKFGEHRGRNNSKTMVSS